MKLLAGSTEIGAEEISVADIWAEGQELVILRGAQGVAEWEERKEGGREGGREEGEARHVLRYRVRVNPPCITELRFSSK
jgi:ABC-type sugar transport system substrate-binding protein